MALSDDGGDPVARLVLRSSVEARWRAALEQLLFFNTGQRRVRQELIAAIDRYGTMEIVDVAGRLGVRVGRLPQAQQLFAVGVDGRPLGCIVFCRVDPERLLVLHVAVAEEYAAGGGHAQGMLLMRLVAAVRAIARRTRGVELVELTYGAGRAIRLRAR